MIPKLRNFFTPSNQTRRRHRHKKHRIQSHKKYNCSPYVEVQKQKNKNQKLHDPDSCFTSGALHKLKNDAHVQENEPHKIHQTLKKKLKCQDDQCILSKLGKENEMTDLFTPFAPDDWKKNPNTWLSNYDIRDVLKQYEHAFPDFKSFEPSAIDYDTLVSNKCVSDELCRFSLKQYLEKNVHKIGIVFNLDEHDEPGSHWVSMYIEIFDGKKEGIVCFFDSTGEKIPKRLIKLKDEIIKQGNQQNVHFTFYNTGFEHQMQNTECGMYSLFFIITMITSKKGGNLKLKKTMTLDEKIDLFGLTSEDSAADAADSRRRGTTRISDKSVEKFRKIYFNRRRQK